MGRCLNLRDEKACRVCTAGFTKSPSICEATQSTRKLRKAREGVAEVSNGGGDSWEVPEPNPSLLAYLVDTKLGAVIRLAVVDETWCSRKSRLHKRPTRLTTGPHDIYASTINVRVNNYRNPSTHTRTQRFSRLFPSTTSVTQNNARQVNAPPAQND